MTEFNITDEDDVEEEEEEKEDTQEVTCENINKNDDYKINESNEKVDDEKNENQLMKSMGLPVCFSSSKRLNKSILKAKSNPLEIYYKKRYSLFSKYDEGIKMDSEAWYSVTPEKLARYIAKRCINKDTCVVLDPFCGVGGNSIAFASVFKKVQVIAMDIDPNKIEMAKHNSKIYNVESRINFIVDDFCNLKYHHLKPDFVFLSPPWGGPSYAKVDKFLLSMMSPDGYFVYNLTKKYISSNIAFYLPRNIEFEELNQLLKPGEKLEIEKNFVNKKIKTITAYFGNLVDQKLNETLEEN